VTGQRLEYIAGLLLCLGAVVFPFSVAGGNLFLGLTIIAGLVSGAIPAGISLIWHRYRTFAMILGTYLLLITIGVGWSMDRSMGLIVIGHSWFWLLLPLSAILFRNPILRRRFFIAASAGLSVHLGLCVLQSMEWVELDTAKLASNADDPTGFIGHIAFGAVYSIWGAFLLVLGWSRKAFERYLFWLLGIWAFTMVFLAQGRGGYLVAGTVLLITLYRMVKQNISVETLSLSAILSVAIATALLAGPALDRLDLTYNRVNTGNSDESAGGEERLIIWSAAFEIWKEHPFLGVGTGGYPNAVNTFSQDHPDFSQKRFTYDHTHNIYVMSLVRWGPLGAIAMILLFWQWIRLSWSRSWEGQIDNALPVISGLAMAVQGLTAISLEGHFTAITAILVLAAWMAMDASRSDSKD